MAVQTTNNLATFEFKAGPSENRPVKREIKRVGGQCRKAQAI
jgi:hypothetical protein